MELRNRPWCSECHCIEERVRWNKAKYLNNFTNDVQTSVSKFCINNIVYNLFERIQSMGNTVDYSRQNVHQRKINNTNDKCNISFLNSFWVLPTNKTIMNLSSQNINTYTYKHESYSSGWVNEHFPFTTEVVTKLKCN